MSPESVPQDKYITINGLRIHYLDWGNEGATPMVLLHGLRGYAHAFDDFAAVVKDQYHVLSLDQRGRGESDWARDADYSTEAYVSDLAAFADALGLSSIVLGGHSMGGRNAIAFTARYPERVASLLIIDIGPDISARGSGRISREIAATPEEFTSWNQARDFLRRQHPKASEESMRVRLHSMLKETPEGKIMWRYDKAIRDARREGRVPPGQDLWPEVRKIRCPTLIVRGGESDVLSRETAEKMAQAMPDSQWVEIAGAGHGVIEDNPQDFNAAVLDFLRAKTPL